MVFKAFGTGLGNFINKSWSDTVNDIKSGAFKNPFNALFKTFNSSDSSAFKNFIKDLDNGITRTKAFTNNMGNASAATKKQAIAYVKCQNDLKKYNTQLNTHKITQDEYNARVDATKAKMAALGVEAETLTIKQRALTVATKLASTAFVALKAIAVTAVISGIIAGISALVNSYQEAIDKAKEASEAVKSQAEEALDYIIYHTNFTYSFSSP